jgi:hypothetical protein
MRSPMCLVGNAVQVLRIVWRNIRRFCLKDVPVLSYFFRDAMTWYFFELYFSFLKQIYMSTKTLKHFALNPAVFQNSIFCVNLK